MLSGHLTVSGRPRKLWESLGSRHKTLALSAFLVTATLLLYGRVTQNEFINFDDTSYVLWNTHVRAGLSWDTVAWAFTAYDTGNWHPLTWLSHALDCELFGLNPAGHHYVSVILHAVNAVLLFLLLERTTRRLWLSFVVAGLFAVHPVNVESVAWVAERKNVLSMLFLLLALHTYSWYVHKPGIRRYSMVALLFTLGLMTKPQVITLPFLLLLWDYWPLWRLGSSLSRSDFTEAAETRTFSWLVLEKVPLVFLSLVSAVITLQAQRVGHSVRTITEYSVASRLENALVSYVRYIGIALWPANLAAVYPHPETSLRPWQVLSSAALLLLISAAVVRLRRYGFLPVGWFWLLGTLVPMIGIVQVGQQALADRYAYIPLIGLFLVVVWGLAEAAQGNKVVLTWFAIAGVSAAGGLMAVTHKQLGYWRNSESLWTRTLAVTSRNYTAEANLADAFAREGRIAEAVTHFKAAQELHAYPPSQMLSLGVFEQQNGHVTEAIEQYKRVLKASIDSSLRVDTLDNLGSAYMQIGNLEAAKSNYASALQMNPYDPAGLSGMGILAMRSGDSVAAANYFSRVAKIRPSDVDFLLLAAAFRNAGRSAEAEVIYEDVKKHSPDLPRAQRIVRELLSSKAEE